MPFETPPSRRAALATGLAVLCPLAGAAQAPRRTAPLAYADHALAMAFAESVSESQSLPLGWLRRQLAQAQKLESVRKLIMPPPVGVPKNWAAYRARFIDARRVNAGLAFWRDNGSWLAEAEERWGVPPEIVVGIIGVETFYGRITGSFRVIDALATLAFDFPAGRSDRSAFFTDELEAFFVLCAREGRDPLAVKGSYAGAMGWPQFMPSSVNRFAVDMDGDGHIDLHGNTADVIGSVAHYMAAFGWERGLPTHHAVTPPQDPAQRATLLAPDIVPRFSATQMAEHGAVLDDAGRAHDGPLALVELHNGDAAPSFVAGTRNFYVVTRYNWSSYYALAVIELGAAVKAALAAAR